ncbi:hypothetical protein GE061_007299 [Apolygus lucorum]|uniref:Uncharacterized protein n=1 Tax=Apolygus lucorum TaxID=248454 RepID=A0A6A4IQF2_APOLU|nr:hypothetical protein GE061_007299 [Apolygus lucorum]
MEIKTETLDAERAKLTQTTADEPSDSSQQALSGNCSLAGGQSEESTESGKTVCFNELVESLDTETGAKTYTSLPAPSTTSVDESLLSEIFNSAVSPFMRAESAAMTSMGSSESKESKVQVEESRESTGKTVTFQIPNSTDANRE